MIVLYANLIFSSEVIISIRLMNTLFSLLLAYRQSKAFCFALLLFRSQHRHPLPSDWIFFVILEAALVVFSVDHTFPTWGYPSAIFLWFRRYCAPTFTGIKDGYILTTFPSTFHWRTIASAFQLSAFRQPYHSMFLGVSFEPVSNHVVISPVTIYGGS